MRKGQRHSKETLEKLRISHLGISPNLEAREKIRLKLTGHEVSIETRRKISEGRRGKIVSVEARAKISAAGIGRKQSAETIAKRAASLTGRECSEETREKIASAQRGIPRGPQSEETKVKRAASLRGRRNTPESIERMRQSALTRAARGISEDTRQRMSESQHKRLADTPHSAETRSRISNALSGIPKTREHAIKVGAAHAGRLRGPLPEEVRAKISAANRKGAKHGREHHSFGKSPAHIRRVSYGDTVFRSTYEVRFAQLLDRGTIVWQYEPRRFDLGDTTYSPDFYLPEYGLWCEVKGWMTPEAERKIDLFRKLHSACKLIVIPKSFFTKKIDFGLM